MEIGLALPAMEPRRNIGEVKGGLLSGSTFAHGVEVELDAVRDGAGKLTDGHVNAGNLSSLGLGGFGQGDIEEVLSHGKLMHKVNQAIAGDIITRPRGVQTMVWLEHCLQRVF